MSKDVKILATISGISLLVYIGLQIWLEILTRKPDVPIGLGLASFAAGGLTVVITLVTIVTWAIQRNAKHRTH